MVCICVIFGVHIIFLSKVMVGAAILQPPLPHTESNKVQPK